MADSLAEHQKNLADALTTLQANLPHVGKAADAQYGKYADLADVTRQVMPALAELGLSFTACPTLIEMGGETKFVLEYRLEHAPTGETRGGFYPLGTGNPQQLGSAITYARRYCLCAVTGVAPDADDDDAQAASRPDGLPVNKDGSLSRSRTTEEEKAAAGVMTDAESREHGKLGPKRAESKPSQRVTATPADDPWYDGAGPGRYGEHDIDYDTPGTITRDQQKAMHARFGELGIKDREARLVKTRALLGVTDLSSVMSSSDLSHNQAARLLEALEEMARTGGVAGLEAEAARRGA